MPEGLLLASDGHTHYNQKARSNYARHAGPGITPVSFVAVLIGDALDASARFAFRLGELERRAARISDEKTKPLMCFR